MLSLNTTLVPHPFRILAKKRQLHSPMKMGASPVEGSLSSISEVTETPQTRMASITTHPPSELADLTQPSTADQNASYIHATSDPHMLKPSLTTIPLELRREIFSYLLRYTKATFHPCSPRYPHRFHLAILYVNKQCLREGSDMFYRENPWLAVEMLGCSGWMTEAPESFRSGVGPFPENVLQMQVAVVDKHGQPDLGGYSLDDPGVRSRHMFLANERFELANWLNRHGFAGGNFPELSVTFRLGLARHLLPTPVLQAWLIWPFYNLRLRQGYVKFQGGFDTRLVGGVCRVMMPSIRWARATAWACYSALLHRKNLADTKMRAGDYDQAANHLLDSLGLLLSILNDYRLGLERME